MPQEPFSDGLSGIVFIDVSFCTGVFEVLKDDSAIETAFVENKAELVFADIENSEAFAKKLMQ